LHDGTRFNEISESNLQETKRCELGSSAIGRMMIDSGVETENQDVSFRFNLKSSPLEIGLRQSGLAENRGLISYVSFPKDYCCFPWFSSQEYNIPSLFRKTLNFVP
jgi:hypothetical protein